MLKAILSYSKKVPVPGQEFSSQSYHLSLETELPDSLRQDEVRAQIHETFELVKTTVENELASAGSNGGAEQPTGPGDPGSNNVPAPRGHDKATNRQVKYIVDLARQKGIEIAELNARCRQLYGVESLYDLTKKQASALLDSLKAGTKKAA